MQIQFILCLTLNFMGLTASAETAAQKVELKDLGVKVGAKAPPVGMDFTLSRVTVGSCDGQKYYDLASLDGCRVNLAARSARLPGAAGLPPTNSGNVSIQPVNFSSAH